jgi:predicted phosphodiesterase
MSKKSKQDKPRLVSNKYTDEQIEYMGELRDQGHSWPEIADKFNSKFKCKDKRSPETLRICFINNEGKEPKEVVERTPANSKVKKGKVGAVDSSSILVISDQHIPYEHPDMFDFLEAVKKRYKPTMVVNIGDEVDKHAMSFHDSDVDLPSAGHELQLSITKIKRMEKLFPEMILVDSNHGSLALRKFKHHGIPMKYLASQHEIYGVSDKWQWVNDLTVELPNGQECYFCHGMVKSGIKLAAQRGTNVVQGHYHTDFKIEYIGNPQNLLFSLQVGCLIDSKSLAFAYDKLNLNRPIIGLGMVIDSKPMLIPMTLNSGGRWNGRL